MVLLGTNLTSAVGVCRGSESGFKIEAINNLTLGNIFLKLCKGTLSLFLETIPTIDKFLAVARMENHLGGRGGAVGR